MAGPALEATAQAEPAAAGATDAASAEQHSAASGSVVSEVQQQQQELAQPKPPQKELQQQQQEVDQVLRSQQAGLAVDWQRLSGQLSAAGFGHLSLLQDGESNAEPELPELFDTLCKVRTRCSVLTQHTATVLSLIPNAAAATRTCCAVLCSSLHTALMCAVLCTVHTVHTGLRPTEIVLCHVHVSYTTHSAVLCHALCTAPCGVQVLHEYQRRDSLMQQLLSERDEMRRASRRSSTESSKLERERDEATRAVNKLKVRLGHASACCVCFQGPWTSVLVLQIICVHLVKMQTHCTC